MEVKKAIKKIVAFSAGATMVGATVLSAMAAADLGSYPAPFVKDGAFNALIVVGDKAAAEDVVGAVDIGASLQYAMKTSKKVASCANAAPTVTNGIAVAKTGQYLNYNTTLYSVRDTPLGSDDLPTILADGRYTESKGNNNNDVTYTQKLYLINAFDAGRFTLLGYGVSPYPTDKDAAEYIYFANNNQNQMYNYRLDFDSNVLYDNTSSSNAVTDIKNSQIEIQGSKYTVTDLKAAGTGQTISEMTLMAGDTLLWLTQDQKITKTVAGVNHEVQVVDVTEAADSCGISVDGDVAWVDKASSSTINGVKIGVTDAKVVHAQLQDQDICQINVGSTELKIRGTSGKIQKDGSDLDNAYGYFIQTAGASAGANAWRGLNVTFYPNDRTYLAVGDSFNDPVFGRWKFSFAGLQNNQYEDAKIEVTSDDKAVFSFVNYEGKTVEVPFFMASTTAGSNNAVQLGLSATEPLLLPGDTYTVTTAGDQVGMLFYFVTSGNVVHILKMDSMDTNNNKTTLKDLTYDKSYEDKQYTTNMQTTSIDLGALGLLGLNVSGDQKTVYYASSPSAVLAGKSKNEARVNVSEQYFNSTNHVWGAATVAFTEKDDSTSSGIGSGVITFQLNNVTASSASYQKMQVGSISASTMTGSDNFLPIVSEKYGNNDNKLAVSRHGTKVRFDSKDYKWAEIQHPKSDVIANVFIAPISADVLAAAAGDLETVTLAKINLGAARLASEIKDVTADNLIVVGGPCANDVAAQVMGQSGDKCADGFTEGKAMVKLYEQTTGKVAMLVAGYSAIDTRRATRVVAGYDQYKANLKGTEVAVSGTSLTDIQVSAPQ